MALLEVSNLGIAFGGLQAVDKVDLTVEEGALCGLIGPNGAGKTTVFNMLTGVYSPTEGDIILNGKNITGQSPASICKAGIARTFQNIRLFKAMTVLDNVKVGLHNQIRYNALTGIFRLPAYYEKEREMKGRAMSLLKNLAWMKRQSSLPPACRTANSVNWKLPAPWPPTPSCFCWTSRRPV